MTEQKPNGRRIRLVALDMDGTLLAGDKTLSLVNKNAINRAIKEGIYIIPATGRPLAGLPEKLLENPGIKYAICSNGASILDIKKKEIIYRRDLKKETVLKIIENLRSFDIMPDIFAEGKIMAENRNMKRLSEFLIPPDMLSYIRDTRTCVDSIFQYAQETGDHIEKINLFFKSLEQRKIVEGRLREISGLTLTCSLNQNLEINDKGVNKGEGLKWLTGHLGLSMEQVMACGDSDNDIDMLKAAGLSVAMGNGSDAIKKMADVVTLSNEEDGVYYAMEKYIWAYFT